MEGGLRYWGPSFFGGFFAYRVCGIPPASFNGVMGIQEVHIGTT